MTISVSVPEMSLRDPARTQPAPRRGVADESRLMGNSRAMGRCTRRDLTIGALVAAALGPAAARAQLPAPAGQIPAPPPAAFDYDVVIEEARRLAMAPYQAPAPAALPAEWRDLTYDRYQQIRFRPAVSLWSDRKAFFRAQFFAAGFIYSTPVAINIVTDGVANPLVASRDLFDWSDVKLKEPPPPRLPPQTSWNDEPNNLL